MTAYDAASRVLEVVASGLANAGRPVPDRRTVVPGALSAWDCEQLTVAVVRPSVPGTPGAPVARARPCGGPTFVELRVELVRPTPTSDDEGSPPLPEELDLSARLLLDDADALRTALDDPVALSGRRGPTTLVGAVESAGPAGGFVAVAALVQVVRG